jgi:hypothetical protein
MHDGCDEGFCFNYWKLSYRRKFIRTICVGGATLLFLTALYATRPEFRTPRVAVFAAVIVLLGLIQAIYNYRKWRAESR